MDREFAESETAMAVRRLLVPWIFVLLSAGQGAATAAGPAAPPAANRDYADFSLEELAGMDTALGAAVIDERTMDSPSAMTVITAEEIEAHGWRTLADVLASVRGFYVTYDRTYSYLGVRGFGRPGDFNTRVLVLCDGQPANDIIYGSGAIDRNLHVDMQMIKRIQVLHGPGAAVYGDGAFFAVVNIVTFDGDDPAGTRAAAGYGSHGQVDAFTAVGLPVGAHGSLQVSAAGFRRDGDDVYWPEFDDPATNHGVFVAGDGERAGHLYGKYRNGGLQATAAWARRDKDVPTGEYGMAFNDNGATVRDERLAISLSGVRVLSDLSTLRGRISYDGYHFRGDYVYDDAEPGAPSERYVQRDVTEGRWWSGDAQWAGVLGRSHRFLIGAGFRAATTALQQSFIVDPVESYLDADNAVNNLGLYAQDQWHISRSSELYFGLRYDKYHSFGGNLAARGAFVTRPDQETSLTLIYGDAFRAPNAYELHYWDGISLKANPDLQPEQGRSWEFVAERALTRGVSAHVALFRNDIDQLIDQYVDESDSLLVFRNSGGADMQGLDLELEAHLRTGLHGRVSASFQSARDDATGARLSNSPARLVKLHLEAARFESPVSAGIEILHSSRRPTLAGRFAEAYFVANLDVTWRTPAAGLKLDLALDNLFDRRFADPGAAHQVQDTLARDGRGFTVRLRGQW